MFNKINELLENKLYMEARQEIAEMNPGGYRRADRRIS